MGRLGGSSAGSCALRILAMLSFASAAFLPASTAGDIIPLPTPCHVNAAVVGGLNDGSSWENAYADLQDALLNVDCNEIWVQAGVYKPSSEGYRGSKFVIPAGVGMYGGFSGTETFRWLRDPSGFPTILSGDVDNNDLNTDGNNIDESTADIVGGNSYHVLTMNSTVADPITTTTVVDGFVITGGQANDSVGGFGNSGGGLACVASNAGNTCSPYLRNLTFSGNQAGDASTDGYGGALFALSNASAEASPALENVTFTGNKAWTQGGAVYSHSQNGATANPSFKHIVFSSNTAGTAGALSITAPAGTNSPSLFDVTFTNNSATSGDGGAIYNEASSGGTANATLANVTFYGNTATNGAAFNNQSLGSSTGSIASPTLKNVTIAWNTASASGGGMHNQQAVGTTNMPVLTNVILWGDAAPSGAEVINEGGAAPTIDYSVVSGSCVAIGGAVCGTHNPVGNPALTNPANHGGFTQTMALSWGSAAIDAGDDATCTNPASVNSMDQRGITRPQGAHCDIGGYERIPPPARTDFDSDHTTDPGVFRPSTRGWYVQDHLATIYGIAGDIPVPGDYDGDGDADVAVFRPAYAGWYVQGQFSTIFGISGDVPVPADYNGDGKTEIAVYRPSNSSWYVKGVTSAYYGMAGDIPVPADYNGDGTTEIAVYRPLNSSWYVKGILANVYGLPGDIPVPGDYGGSGIAHLAVYRPSNSGWFVQNFTATVFGLPGDVPVPGDYNADGNADFAVYRPSTSGWYVRAQFATIYGLVGDYPLPAPDTNADGDPY